LTAEQATMVFDRFWRGDPARNRTTGGTGLGLAISLEDARLHGGYLQVAGRPGEGAAFRLTLPRHQQAPLAGEPSPVPLDPTRARQPPVVTTEPAAADPRAADAEESSGEPTPQEGVPGEPSASPAPAPTGTHRGLPEQRSRTSRAEE